MRMADPVNIYKEPPLGTTDTSDFAIAEPLGANRRGGLGLHCYWFEQFQIELQCLRGVSVALGCALHITWFWASWP
jgi:hypothetical protein